MKRLLNGVYWVLSFKPFNPVRRYFFGMGSYLGHLRWELNTPKDCFSRTLMPLNDDEIE